MGRRSGRNINSWGCNEKSAGGGGLCTASCGNWSVVVEPRWQGGTDPSQWECYIWNCISHSKIPLPNLTQHPDTFFKCVLTRCLTRKQFLSRLVFFFSHKPPFFIISRPGAVGEWLTCDYSRHLNVFYDAVATRSGNVYVIGSNGIFSEIVIEWPFRRVQIGPLGRLPKSVLYNKQQLVNYGPDDDDLFIVQRKSLLDLEVWKMKRHLPVHLPRERWERIWDLGDIALFLSSKYSRAFSGLEWGIRGNCVYFMEDNDDDDDDDAPAAANNLHVFCLGDESLSVCSIPLHSERNAFWRSDTDLIHLLRLVDTHQKGAQIILKEEKKAENKKQAHEDGYFEINGSILSMLPMDLQEIVAKFVAHTNVKDYMSLRSVCRRWRSLAPPIRWRSDLNCSTSIECWLMLFQREKGLCSFYDPMNNSTYYMNSKELLGCEIRCSNDGWFLVTHGLRSVFFYEFFSKTKIKLPDLRVGYCFDGISFSASPISSEWVVFAISHSASKVVDISYIKAGDENWTSSRHYNGRPFVSSGCNPVFYNQCFYCLGEEGSLGTFRLTEAGGSWRIHAHPLPSQFLLTMSRGFLVSFKKNLFSVFVGHMGKSVHVFQLNSSSTEWVRLTNLGSQLFFFSHTSSLVLPAIGGVLKNTINFPTFACSNNSYMVYSLDNSRFEALGSDYCAEDLHDARELLGATWLQPRVTRTTG